MEAQKAFQTKTSPHITKLRNLQVLRVLLTTICWIIIIILFYDSNQVRVENLHYLYNVSVVELSVAQIQLVFWMDHATRISKMQTPSVFRPLIGILDCTETDAISYEETYTVNAVAYIRMGRITNQNIILSLTNLLASDTNMSLMINALHRQNAALHVYNGLTKAGEALVDMRMGYTYYFSIVRQETSVANPDFTQSQFVREMIPLFLTLTHSSNNFLTAIKDQQITSNNQDINDNLIFMLVIGICYLLILSILTIIVYKGLSADLTKMVHLCHSLPELTKRDGISNVVTESGEKPMEVENDLPQASLMEKSKILFFGSFGDNLCHLIVALLIMCFVIPENDSITKFSVVTESTVHSAIRLARITELAQNLLATNLIPTIGSSDPTLIPAFTEAFSSMIDDLYNAHTQLQKTDFGTSSQGMHIKSFQTKVNCVPDPNDISLHTKFVCNSLDQNIVSFIELCQSLKLKANDPNFCSSEDLLHAIHLATGHCTNPLIELLDLLLVYAESLASSINSIVLGFGLFSIFGMIFACLMNAIHIRRYIQIYNVGIKLILRLDPFKVISNAEMMQYLLSDNSKKGKAKSVNSAIVMNSPHPILFMNSGLSILGINSVFVTLFGFDPAHIIGHPLEKLISTPESLELIQSFIAGDDEILDNNRVVCNLENGNEMNSDITIYKLPISEKSQSESNFAIVFTDCSTNEKLLEQKSLIQQQNENLSRALIPSFLQSDNNQADGAIIGAVFPQATVAMLRFCDVSLTLAPADICTQFSDIWTKFDGILLKYPQVEKVSLFNGVYTVVSGSLDEVSDESSALEAFHFLQNCFAQFQDFQLLGTLEGAIEYGGKTEVMMIGTDTKRIIINGENYETCWKLLQLSSSGKIAFGEKGYLTFATLDVGTVEEKKTSFGKCYLLQADNNSDVPAQ